MNKTVLIIAVALIITTLVFSQESEHKKANKGKLYLLSGVQYINTKNINKMLVSSDLPGISKFHSFYGYGGCWQSGKWIFGGEGYQMKSGDLDKDDDDLSTADVQIGSSTEMGYFYIGYSVFNTEKFYLSPRVGIGGGGMKVQINQKTETTLDELFEVNYSNNLTTSGAIIHTGLKFGFLLDKHWDFNFDLGYNHGFKNSWDVANGELTESVKDGIGGAFAQITMGFTF